MGLMLTLSLDNYEKAIVWLQQLDEWIPNLEAYARDDIEILKNDILAKAEIHNEQFEKAEEYLENAAALLENDDEEFSKQKRCICQFDVCGIIYGANQV